VSANERCPRPVDHMFLQGCGTLRTRAAHLSASRAVSARDNAAIRSRSAGKLRRRCVFGAPISDPARCTGCDYDFRRSGPSQHLRETFPTAEDSCRNELHPHGSLAALLFHSGFISSPRASSRCTLRVTMQLPFYRPLGRWVRKFERSPSTGINRGR